MTQQTIKQLEAIMSLSNDLPGHEITEILDNLEKPSIR